MSVEKCCANLLSESECIKVVLKALGEVKLISYEIVPASKEAVGYLGDYYKLNVTVERKNNQLVNISFFIKTLPLFNELHKKIILEMGIIKKEASLYSTLFEEMKRFSSYKWHPDMYLCRDDLIVMEDLMQLKYNHQFFNLNVPTTYVWPVLKSLAAMHANSIVFEEMTGANIGRDYQNCVFETSICKGKDWYSIGLKAIIQLASIHPKLQTLEYQNFISKDLLSKLELTYDLAKTSTRFRNTLCHRDVWEKNMVFTKDKENLQSILFDFQIAAYAPPAVDVTFFLYLNANRASREPMFSSYLNYYYDSLVKFTNEMDVDIADHINRDQFYQSCEEFKLLSLVLTAVYAPIAFLPDGVLGNLNQDDPKKFCDYMTVDRSQLMFEHIETFPEFRIRVFDVIEELVEYVFKCN